MMHDMGQSAMILMMILAVVIAVLWIALPFAVFGIKKRLDAILMELKRSNANIGPPEDRQGSGVGLDCRPGEH